MNTYTDGKQMSSSVTGLSGGGFVVTWQSYDLYKQDGFDYGVYGQLFDSFGNKVGSEFLVNTRITKSERNPSVAALSGGDFVVTWESYETLFPEELSYADVYGQLFDSSGNKIGSEFRVNTYINSVQVHPSVTGLSGEGFVVTWHSNLLGESRYDIYGRLFDGTGNKVGSEFLVNTYTNSDQVHPSVTGLSGGGFVVTWESYLQDGWGYGIYGQLFEISLEIKGKAMPWIPLLLLDD